LLRGTSSRARSVNYDIANILLHIVAPNDRREQVRRGIIRPVFSVLEGGAMSDRCSFISYDAIDDILAQPNLGHMRESIVEEFEEFFEP